MSPAREHAVESLSTLKFGRRCKMVTTRARRGTVVDDKALLQRYRRELDRLRARLEAAPTPVVMSDDVDDDGERRLRELEDRRQEAQREVDAAEQQRSDLRAQVEHLTRLILTSQSVAEERAEPTSMLSVPRRAARLSDIGPSSPARLGLQPASPIIPATRPFALEAELASLRRELASALSARQAAEAARRQEAEQWSGRAAELEAANKALEDDLNAADTWCKDAKERIAAAEAREHEAREANRLLQLVAKSKTGRDEAPESADARQVRETSQRLAVEQARREVEQAKDAELRRIREEHEAMAAQLAALNTSLAEERKNAEQARTELSEIQRESLQENAERDFEQLVRESEQDVPSAAAKDDAQQVELQRRQAELDERERKLDEEARRLEELRNAPRPLPVPSPTGPSRTELLQRLKTLEEANAALTLKNAEPLPPRATLPMSPNFVASKPGPSHDGATLVALQIELDLQRSRIASLERQLAEEREKGRQVGSALSSPPTPSASPVRRQTAALLATDKLARGGSVREYRKYAPSEPAGSLLGRTRMSAAGDLNTGLGRGGAAVDEAIRAEREEITRLNAVITSQRAIMAELEKSVAAWKERLRKQQEIISRLVEGSSATADLSALTAAMAPSPAPSRLQEVTLNSSGRKRLSSGTASSSAVSSFGTEPLRRAGTTTSAFGRAGATTSSSSPYYGAHTFNRPPAGLGLTPSSPTKAAGAYWSGLPGGPGPEPLPMPERLAAEGRTARRRPRRTIESEIAALSSSPRVEATKSRLLEPSSPAKLSHALPVPTRATREYYV
jgi:centromeric protein E